MASDSGKTGMLCIKQIISDLKAKGSRTEEQIKAIAVGLRAADKDGDGFVSALEMLAVLEDNAEVCSATPAVGALTLSLAL